MDNTQAQKLKQRIKALQDTYKITKALDSISLVKMRKSTDILKRNKVYFDRIQTAVTDLINHTATSYNQYLGFNKKGKEVFLIIAGDKGFCGAYNHTLCKYALDILSKYDKQNVVVYCVGYKLIEFFARHEWDVNKDFVYYSSIQSHIDATTISKAMHKLYLHDDIASINILYTQLIGGSLCKPQHLQVLPIIARIQPQYQDIETEEFFKEVVYEPSVEEVFEALIDQYLNGIVFGALAHSAVAEHTSRCMAMSNASDNAQELLDKLKTRRNQG
ncbi:MAG: F0F1 ATP synthase subunit gamma [Clostridiales bacterium]|nr:F0F1 ATP synthase subunit gamma [Clostridiales bacterium]